MPRHVMPRSVLLALKRQATKVLTSLRREILQREKELTLLKEEAQRWQSAVSGRPMAAASATLHGRAGGQGMRTRIDWNAILSALPNTFTPKDVAQKTNKPMEQVYAGLARWVKGKKIRRGKNGYQKVM